MSLYRTTLDGRSYEIDVHPEKINEPMCSYVQVYRTRKDGSRGMQLMSHREEAWNVWKTIRAAVQAA